MRMRRQPGNTVPAVIAGAFVAGLTVGIASVFGPGAMGQSATAAGDPGRGRLVFANCRLCHKLDAGATPGVGPNLDALFGRTAGSSASFGDRYSHALRNSGIVWNAERLDEWLANPRTFLPGNKMAFAGIVDARDRLDLIAYLQEALGPAVAAP